MPSPASNNALVAYTPSHAWISIRGNWPLYPTCNVVTPHTRSMNDILSLLEVIIAEDLNTDGEFTRAQPFIKQKKPWPCGKDSVRGIKKSKSLTLLRIAVPEVYIGVGTPPGAIPLIVSDEVVELWCQAKQNLELLGAEIVLVPDFPL
ncbi:hypothetical protein NHQ30_009778 [Ciborinia camelliae]|nr:hypothetical protein NHQ30_009778 [Ciborinia camelliae]